MGWADEHELEETRIVKGHSNAIGARDIERERMSEHQIRDQFTRAPTHHLCATQITGILLFPTLEALMEASRPEMSPLGGAGRSHVMAAQHAAAQHSVRRSNGRLNQVACTLQLVRVLSWYMCGFVTETPVHVVPGTNLSLKVSLLRMENV